ncbi:flagellar hook-length control protein FliK [Polycladidibacter hongkongensis]|uniref:flagellar hook-length control protein FliK n=1 Tax=Polycladidibacter hongkongensis TaxID=1647556 RepID=UPI00082F7B6C|nr:flagellar hook-length control protein FliK [Pseudovibrio hongkongensis]
MTFPANLVPAQKVEPARERTSSAAANQEPDNGAEFKKYVEAQRNLAKDQAEQARERRARDKDDAAPARERAAKTQVPAKKTDDKALSQNTSDGDVAKAGTEASTPATQKHEVKGEGDKQHKQSVVELLRTVTASEVAPSSVAPTADVRAMSGSEPLQTSANLQAMLAKIDSNKTQSEVAPAQLEQSTPETPIGEGGERSAGLQDAALVAADLADPASSAAQLATKQAASAIAAAAPQKTEAAAENLVKDSSKTALLGTLAKGSKTAVQIEGKLQDAVLPNSKTPDISLANGQESSKADLKALLSEAGSSKAAEGAKLSGDALGEVKVLKVETHFAPLGELKGPSRQVAEAMTGPRTSAANAAQVIDEINQSLADLRKGQPMRALQIQLRPDNMGTVRVHMQLRGNELEISMMASTREAAEMLKADKQVLHRVLTQAGYKADATNLTIQFRDDAGEQFRGATGGQQDGQSAQSGRGGEGAQGGRDQARGEQGKEQGASSQTITNAEAPASGALQQRDLREGIYL